MALNTDLPEVLPILTDEFRLLDTYFADLIDRALRPPE